VRQRVNYSCGDVAALALLRYWDAPDYASVTETDLYAPLHTTAQDGTDPQPIVDYLKTVRGLSAELRLGATVADLVAAIDHGEPPIVDLEAWKDESRTPDVAEWAADWDDGHYAVLVGYDDRDFYFMDPSTSDHYTYVPRGELEPRWHDVLTGSNARIEHAAIFVHSGAHATAAHLDAHDAVRMR
jgi:predicted double-glycine peptidase